MDAERSNDNDNDNDNDSRLRTRNGIRRYLDRRISRSHVSVTSEVSSHTSSTSSGTSSSGSDKDGSQPRRSRSRSSMKSDRSLSSTRSDISRSSKRSDRSRSSKRSDRSLSSTRISRTTVSRSTTSKQLPQSRRQRREERESRTAANAASSEDCGKSRSRRDYDLSRRDRLSPRRRSQRGQDPPSKATVNSHDDQDDHLPQPSAAHHIDLFIEIPTGCGTFHHSRAPALSFVIENMRGTFIHPQDSKLVFRISFDVATNLSEDHADPYEGGRYFLECSLGRLSKIRYKNPKTDILGTLAYWNKVQKEKSIKTHDRRGTLAIDAKNKNEVELAMCGRLSSLTDETSSMIRHWMLSQRFCNDFEGFANDALKFHAMLHGESGDIGKSLLF